jgi:signal transduction histidine kinase
MVDTFAPLAWQSHKVEVIAQIGPDVPETRLDEGRLEQILANLLRNGIRHTPPGGIVAVAVSNQNDWVQIEVRDTGEGIASEILPHIWTRFFRGKGAHVDSKAGTGLGLALVKELTEAMGGTVAVESTVGEGSVFTVRFP